MENKEAILKNLREIVSNVICMGKKPIGNRICLYDLDDTVIDCIKEIAKDKIVEDENTITINLAGNFIIIKH